MAAILFPTDFSACSNAALRYAVALARDRGATLVVLHVASPSFGQRGSELDDAEAARLQNLVNRLTAPSSGQAAVAYDFRVVEGDPVAEIIHATQTGAVELVVMGTTGRGGLKRLVMGSVAEAVVRRAACPVLTLRQPKGPVEAESPPAPGVPHGPGKEVPLIEFREAGSALTDVDSSPALALVTRAITARASDIHIDPAGDRMGVRFRIDGQMEDYCRLSGEAGHALLTQFKLLANLNIAEPFHPKEGRLQLPAALANYEVRIAAVPVLGGEAVSLRLQHRERLARPLEELGFSAASFGLVQRMLRHGEGVVLVTGPTGSGKTTTVYSMLCALDDGRRNLVTIEDPVEYSMPSFRQLEVDLPHGVSMTSGLKTLLRLDPDVVLVGEIRDPEAAETAMRAASSGKYVFTTIHTRDVASTVTALRDLHIDNRSLAGNLTGIISQRLVRRLCRECSLAAPPSEEQTALFLANGVAPASEVRRAIGCTHCRGTGYFDRIGVFEVVVPGTEIAAAIERGVGEEELRTLICGQGTPSLQADALQKVHDGITSLDEVQAMAWVEI